MSLRAIFRYTFVTTNNVIGKEYIKTVHATLAVILNGNVVMEYDTHTRLPGRQRRFLEKMDLDMDNGICLDTETIVSPTRMQRAHYVAMTLIRSLHTDNPAMVSMSCAYLANRIPELKEIRANEDGENVSMELVL